MDSLRNLLTSLDYGRDYIALWVSASLAFAGVALAPLILYLIFYSDIDKAVKRRLRGERSRDFDPEDPELLKLQDKRKGRGGGKRRRKRLISRRLLMFHIPAMVVLTVLSTILAFGLTRLLSTT